MFYSKNLKTIGELCNSKDGGRRMHFRVKVGKLLAASLKSGLNNDFIEALKKKIQVTCEIKVNLYNSSRELFK